jgi:hypothetical protein
MGDHLMTVVQPDPELGVGQGLSDLSLHQNGFFLCHIERPIAKSTATRFPQGLLILGIFPNLRQLSLEYTLSKMRSFLQGWGTQAGFPDGVLLAQFGSATNFAGFFIMLAFAQLFVQTASLQELLEAAQGRADWFFVVNAHP